MKRSPKLPRREAGVGLVTAIFLLTVLAGLGVAMVGLYTNQQATANLDLLGARAYQAARAGLEWGMYQQMVAKRDCAAPQRDVFQMPAGTSLSGFTVVVTCTQQANLTPTQQRIFLITSAACNYPTTISNFTDCTQPSNPEAVRRQLEVQL